MALAVEECNAAATAATGAVADSGAPAEGTEEGADNNPLSAASAAAAAAAAAVPADSATATEAAGQEAADSALSIAPVAAAAAVAVDSATVAESAVEEAAAAAGTTPFADAHMLSGGAIGSLPPITHRLQMNSANARNGRDPHPCGKRFSAQERCIPAQHLRHAT
jgi:hypothetical protein